MFSICFAGRNFVQARLLRSTHRLHRTSCITTHGNQRTHGLSIVWRAVSCWAQKVVVGMARGFWLNISHPQSTEEPPPPRCTPDVERQLAGPANAIVLAHRGQTSGREGARGGGGACGPHAGHMRAADTTMHASNDAGQGVYSLEASCLPACHHPPRKKNMLETNIARTEGISNIGHHRRVKRSFVPTPLCGAHREQVLWR